MKTLVGLAIAGALSVGAANAAIVAPGTGTGELIEWVVDNTTGQVYARGIQVSELTILPAASVQSPATYATSMPPVSTGTTLPTIAPDSNLTTFLAQDGGGNTFSYGVLSAGQTTGGAVGYQPGASVLEFTSTNTLAASTLKVPLSSALGSEVVNVQNTVTTLNSIIGGTPGDGTSANVSSNYSPTSAEFLLYNLTTPLTAALGTNMNLYAYTGDGAKTATSQVYTAGLIEMTANGTLEETSGPPPVPLPAAVWLLGSGLLGLLGVGRRRTA